MLTWKHITKAEARRLGFLAWIVFREDANGNTYAEFRTYVLR
jgi:hypothetical protein